MSIFNRKPRQYSYKPIYFDAEKEARDNRLNIKSKDTPENYVPGSIIRTTRRDRILGLDRPVKSNWDKNKVLIRLSIAMCLLIVIGYAIMKSGAILTIVELNQ